MKYKHNDVYKKWKQYIGNFFVTKEANVFLQINEYYAFLAMHLVYFGTNPRTKINIEV